MNHPNSGGPSDHGRARQGAEGGMGDGGDPADAACEAGVHPALEKELKQGGLGQALAGVTGQPGLAGAEERTSRKTDEAKVEAGAETPAKE